MSGKLPHDEAVMGGEAFDDLESLEETAPSAPIKEVSWIDTIKLPVNGLTGADLIGELVKLLPHKPGVYRMMNEAGDVLYVGKAKSLRKRVANYAQGRGHSNRIAKMIGDTRTMEFITTKTETDALLLEATLIKRLRPRFNVLLRDDKSFPYILISGDHRAPGLFKHRGARSRKGDYFGPFASSIAVSRTINTLERAFLIRSCTDSIFEGRSRPCLLFQIKRCSGPCTGEISDADYHELVNEARDFLSGKSQSVKATIVQAMNEAAEVQDYERAGILRDRLSALTHVQNHQGTHHEGVDEADVFAIQHQGGLSCIQVFFYRTGQNWGNRAYFPRADASFTSSDVLGAFVAQFYDDKPCPRLVLLSESIEELDLLANALSERSGYRVNVQIPQRGAKRTIVEHALTNAREAHGRKLAETASQARLLAGMAETFGLAYAPRRIEIFDNSHISGTNAVGAMVVAGPEGFVKNQYRQFNIKSEEMAPGDDFAMMREIMTRRFFRLLKDEGLPDRGQPPLEDAPFPAWPDVILIDGGTGQMSAVRAILSEMGIKDHVVAIGIAKGADREAGRERFFMEGKPSFTLPPRDPVLYFVQRLRDEAHRFAIGSHRARRKKALVINPLDEIAGIGPTRKRALLQHFGNAKTVASAAISDLTTVPGISQAMAKLIYDHFHDSA